MRELTYEEMEQVDGGVAPVVVAAGITIAGGIMGGYQTGGWQGAVVGGTLAVPAAIFGGAAVAAYGAGRAMFSAYAMGTMWLQNRAVNNIASAGGDS